MTLPLMALIYRLLFNNDNTRLNKLIKYLKENNLINNKNWDNINHLKLNDSENELLIGNDDIYLRFNDKDIILNYYNHNISLETIDTKEALIKIKKIIKTSNDIIEDITLLLDNIYISFNNNDYILNIDNKRIRLNLKGK